MMEKNNYVIGNVISIDGLNITILMKEQSNLESFHYNGVIYDGVSIGSYVGIIRGSNKIVCRVEKEYLEDLEKDPSKQEFSRDRFERRLVVSLIGNIYKDEFEFGVKHFPMIFNEVVLLSQAEVKTVLQKDISKSKHKIPLGETVSNGIPVEVAWDKLFNTHIGIFGNTGSGKSNTLTKLYTELFNKSGNEIEENFGGKSKFFLLDFNGEYVNDEILNKNKSCLQLSTHDSNGDKLPLAPNVFWDSETLAILYSATEKTQKPFLKSAIEFLLKDSYDVDAEKIISCYGTAFYITFSKNNNKELLSLLNKALEIIGFNSTQDYKDEEKHPVDLSWLNYLWHSSANSYYSDRDYINDKTKDDILDKRTDFESVLKENFRENIDNLTITDQIKIAVCTHLVYRLAYGKVNYEHISPLINRIESRAKLIEKTITLKNSADNWKTVNVISFRKCNAEAKKMLPLLIVKQLYDEHKNKLSSDEDITATVHLIIDEAHNILSYQSTRESEVWKDYRLEIFEEIIKEGRKFGFYITLASQRPSDISSTIMSQLHNYFIHRLVNDNDLNMIANTVASIDFVSRRQIPVLAPGQCIITGTSFSIPLLVQIVKLSKEESPASDNADLVKLWSVKDK